MVCLVRLSAWARTASAHATGLGLRPFEKLVKVSEYFTYSYKEPAQNRLPDKMSGYAVAKPTYSLKIVKLKRLYIVIFLLLV